MITQGEFDAPDLAFMQRCVSLAYSGVSRGEYPFAAVISRRGQFVCEAHNRVRSDGDVTRHAEMVALSEAQKKLSSTSLEDCTLYSTVEPCAMCAYAIRESRIGRVISGLCSPVMGGYSKWNILADHGLSSNLPEVFATPPQIQFGCLHDQVQEAFRDGHPLIWTMIKARNIFTANFDRPGSESTSPKMKTNLKSRVVSCVRTGIDRLWRA